MKELTGIPGCHIFWCVSTVSVWLTVHHMHVQCTCVLAIEVMNTCVSCVNHIEAVMSYTVNLLKRGPLNLLLRCWICFRIHVP